MHGRRSPEWLLACLPQRGNEGPAAKRAAREQLLQQLQEQDAAARAALEALRSGAPLEDAQRAADKAMRYHTRRAAAGWLAGWLAD
jgi:hypothetical protein